MRRFTVTYGMHVPLIANWPGRVVPGKVHTDNDVDERTPLDLAALKGEAAAAAKLLQSALTRRQNVRPAERDRLDGLKVTVSGEELRALLAERIEDHLQRAARWKREQARPPEEGTDEAPIRI